MAHAFDNLYLEVRRLADKSEGRHQELVRNVMTADKLNAMDQRIQNIESTVQGYQKQFTSLQGLLSESHSRLTVGLPQHMSESKDPSLFISLAYILLNAVNDILVISTKSPRIGFFLFIFMVFQLLLAGSYVVYKRRKANGPKKYL